MSGKIFTEPKKSQIEIEKAYQNIIKDNELLIGLKFVKNSHRDVYDCTANEEMPTQIKVIIDYCKATKINILNVLEVYFGIIWKVYATTLYILLQLVKLKVTII